ncbi:methyltransferase family protein [Polluticaenibacter yanchengensis]|uniref:Isoprenylcysteine carboxylmethyltransferase family protein n=1 Tax=Polluticaenibacter yanchengensis TaxID=3014562 RepID=A0ABT4UMJ3_9BACT|nr:isoprenylcysteine carboxylmethyltransferase family protein [Chitinophagaceae bacterium LY-5]
MEQFIKIFLPVYFSFYFLATFLVPSLLVAKRAGQSALVLPNDNTVEGLTGRYFKLAIVLLSIYTFAYALFPGPISFFLSAWNASPKMQIAGIMILAAALGISITALYYMKNSWRIGIDKNNKTDLITGGIFAYSRNPVFFSILLGLTGLMLLTPNTFTISISLAIYILIQMQIRLEEAFLTEIHGQKYLNYKNETRRFI